MFLAGRTQFGFGVASKVGEIAKGLRAERAVLVTDGNMERFGVADRIEKLLQEAGVECCVFAGVEPEPSVETTDAVAELAREHDCQLVVGLGGGSCLDVAKAVSVLITNIGSAAQYQGLNLVKERGVPKILMPTTAGTGSEVTRNAVLASPEHKVKASQRSPSMIPRVAIVDPVLTYGMPPAVTASTGLDALTQLIEPFTCNRTNPLVDGFCRDGIARAARSLRRAWANGRDATAREDMALASLYGGLALANAGLGVVHGFAGVVGGAFAAPHGAVCAALLPHAMAANRAALLAREPHSPMLARYDEISRLLTNRADAVAEDGVEWVRELTVALGVPSLAAHGVAPADVPVLVEKAAVASGTKANPIVLTRDELAEILARAL